MMRRSRKYRCYPNPATQRRLWRTMRRGATPVWNACVGEREQAGREYRERLYGARLRASSMGWRMLSSDEDKAIRQQVAAQQSWPSAYSQYKHVRKREHPEYAEFDAQMLQSVVAKVDASQKAFLALWVKGDKQARPPRQTDLHRCLTYRQSGWKLNGNRLTLAGIGHVRIRLHRPIVGTIKTVSLTEKNGRWYVSFSCESDDFFGVCGPVSAVRSGVQPDWRQKYVPTGGNDPDLGGTHNESCSPAYRMCGGNDPDLGGTHNSGRTLDPVELGGNDPSSGGIHNRPPVKSHCTPGGNDPSQGGTHNFCFSLLDSLPGGDDPDFRAKLRRGWADGGELPRRVAIWFPGDVFLRDSLGNEIPHPEFYTRDIASLRRLSRAKDRKRPGSRNRRKARRQLARWHEHIANQRDAFLWPIARWYAMNFRRIEVPAWPLKTKIQYAFTSTKARKLCDASYGRFVTMLSQKCEEFKTELIVRKDEDQWQKEMWEAREVATLEAGTKLLHRGRRLVKRGVRALPPSYRKACARAVSLSI